MTWEEISKELFEKRTAKRFQIIHLGNPYDFVVKDHQTNKTYGTLQGDDKSLMELLNELHEENKKLKQVNEMLQMDFTMTERNLIEENDQLKFENNELKCALALDEVEYIIADGKKIDIPPYYEFEQRYDSVMHRREYDGYD